MGIIYIGRHRIVSSAYDLAENNDKGVTVGFSGTKDQHLLLPTQVCVVSVCLYMYVYGTGAYLHT
jgi:hypothetical protein